jgi:PIN domain nuclease of toxin-antitoxin system
LNILLDTHIALWALSDDQKLSPTARTLILDANNRIFTSVASMWEVAIKKALKPHLIPVSGIEFLHFCEHAGYESVPVRDRHVIVLESLPPVHADPFDRILIAQAKAEGMLFLTHDTTLAAYGAEVRIV